MGWRGTLGLGIAVLAAALYLYRDVVGHHQDASWSTLFDDPRPTPPGEQITHLLVFDPRSVTAIRIRRGEREWQVQRTADGWHGAERPADVDDFLKSLLEMAEIMPLDVAPGELADHGLDPPETSIVLERAGQPPIDVRLGRRNPSATGVYAQIGAGGPVALTGALIMWELDKATRAFQ